MSEAEYIARAAASLGDDEATAPVSAPKQEEGRS